MKKIALALIVLALVCTGLFAADYTSSKGTNDSEFDPNKTVEFVAETTKNNRIVTKGDIDKSLYTQPIFITSFGQSTEGAMLETVMKKCKLNYTYSPMATADKISGVKTLVIAVGASTKGLGAAGISIDDELARAKAIMDVVKKENINVICVHIGGSARRGQISDVLTDMVLEESSYLVLKEDANFDYKFTKYASEHNLPVSLIYATKDCIDVFKNLYN